MKRRLPDMMATTPVFDLLRILGADPADSAAVMRVLSYRLAAKVERYEEPWGESGTTELSVRYPVGGVRLEITARIVGPAAARVEPAVSTPVPDETGLARELLTELARARGSLDRVERYAMALGRPTGGA